jgi:hypothetical protein
VGGSLFTLKYLGGRNKYLRRVKQKEINDWKIEIG